MSALQSLLEQVKTSTIDDMPRITLTKDQVGAYVPVGDGILQAYDETDGVYHLVVDCRQFVGRSDQDKGHVANSRGTNLRFPTPLAGGFTAVGSLLVSEPSSIVKARAAK